MRARLIATLIATLLLVPVMTACATKNYSGAGRFNDTLEVHDKYLLTPEQQRELVRNGEVTVCISGQEITFYNTPEMRPYLNEGALCNAEFR